MQLQVLGSSSAGNCYLLTSSKNETLILECGVKFSAIKKALDFNLENVCGCLVTHEHRDHCISILDVAKAGINVYATKGTLSGYLRHNIFPIEYFKEFEVGSFKILPFDVKHDAAEPCGFLIEQGECGLVCFITDSYYVPYVFPKLNNIIIEANYSQDILDAKVAAGASPEFLRNRVLKSHMGLDTCKQFLAANELNLVNNIVLIHLSDSNSNAKQFQAEISQATDKQTFIAKTGLTIPFNKTPF